MDEWFFLLTTFDWLIDTLKFEINKFNPEKRVTSQEIELFISKLKKKPEKP